jgi:N-acyl-D-amino-acid deacylase
MPLTVVVQGGTIYDGSGSPGVRLDVLIDGDRIVGIGHAPAEHAALVIDACGLAVAPGFVNVLSHAWAALQQDGSGASDLLQGVTTEVFGESASPGPLSDEYAAYLRSAYGDHTRTRFAHLGDGLDDLVGGGVSPNVASFVGGTNLRTLAAGFDNRPLTAAELRDSCALLDEELSDGALGVGTALIYPPGRFASTDELAALCEVIAAHDAVYISHLRSEAATFLEALDELFTLAERTGVRAEIYHLKAAGRSNWPKMGHAIERIEQARARGLAVTADMYPYEAGSTSLAACIPPRFHDGGVDALLTRLGDPAQCELIAAAMREDSGDFENLLLAAGGGSGVLLLRDLADGTPGNARRLDDLAREFGLDDEATLLEIVARDPFIWAAYFFIDPANIELGMVQPWVSIGSDASAHPNTAPWSERATHPRTYGTFARVLGHYSRDRGLIPLAEAIRRMTSLPADNLRLRDRGRLAPGAYADLVVLDPATVTDTATWTEPHSYARGVRDVLVNGVLAVHDGKVTAARPGRRLRRAI